MLRVFIILTFLILAACERSTSAPSPPPTSTSAPAIINLAAWPAFQNGGPLLGCTEAISPPPMKVRWTYRTAPTDPAPVKSGLAIVGDTAYVPDSRGTLHALYLATGKPRWTFKAADEIVVTPLIANGRVYFGDLYGNFFALESHTGKKIWSLDTGYPIHASANIHTPPSRANPTTLSTRIIFANDGGKIICLNPDDGKIIWNAAAADRVNSAVALSSDTLYLGGCDNKLRALSLDDGLPRMTNDLDDVLPGSPALLDDRLIVGTGHSGVICFSRDTFKRLWTFDQIIDNAMVLASPAVSGDTAIIAAQDHNAYALDTRTGKLRWKFPTAGSLEASPIIAGPRVYVASEDRRLYVLDLASGKMLWQFAAAQPLTATPAVGMDVVLIADTGGTVYCLEPLR